MTSDVDVTCGQRQYLSPDERTEVMSRIAELMTQLEVMGSQLRGLANGVDRGRENELVTSLVQRHAA